MLLTATYKNRPTAAVAESSQKHDCTIVGIYSACARGISKHQNYFVIILAVILLRWLQHIKIDLLAQTDSHAYYIKVVCVGVVHDMWVISTGLQTFVLVILLVYVSMFSYSYIKSPLSL